MQRSIDDTIPGRYDGYHIRSRLIDTYGRSALIDTQTDMTETLTFRPIEFPN